MSESKRRYTLAAGSELEWLQDGSGIAIYNAYSGSTHFLHVSASDPADNVTSPSLEVPFTSAQFQKWLNLTDIKAENALQQLVERKIFWLVT